MSSETGVLDGWLDRASDRLNPLLVRETRQWLKSRLFVGTFFLLLGVSWFVAMAEMLVPRAVWGLVYNDSSGEHFLNGRALFEIYFLILTVSVFLTVPLTTFFSFSREHADDAIEIIRLVPLASARIAWGKLQTALLQMGLYFAAVAPFVCLTYLLRGIGLFSIVLTLLLIAIGGTSLAVLGLALGSFSRTTGWLVFNILLLLAATGITFLISFAVGMAFSRRDDVTTLVVGCICIAVVGSSVIAIGMGTAIQNVRPNAGMPKVAFINIDRLLRIAEAGRAFAGILRREFPVAGTARKWTAASSSAFPRVHQEAMRLALTLERTLFDARPSYGDRSRYMTYPFARESLRSLLYTFDLILFELWWNELSTGTLQPRGCRMLADGTPVVSDITPSLLETLESSAATIDQLCLENADVDANRPGVIVDETIPGTDVRTREFLGEVSDL